MRVFVDTKVLFPFSVMDLMLALTEDSLHGIVYVHLVDGMPGSDPDDRHHAAAAVAAGADALITWNLADFPAEAMARLGVRVVDPDTYLCELYEEMPQEVAETIVRVAGGKRNPPMTRDEIVARLGKAGVTRFAERLG